MAMPRLLVLPALQASSRRPIDGYNAEEKRYNPNDLG